MKQDFAPYLNLILPSVFTMATLNPEMSISGSNYGGGLTDVLHEMNPNDNDSKKNLNVNTQETDEIDEAVKMLSAFIDELGPAFFPWVE